MATRPVPLILRADRRILRNIDFLKSNPGVSIVRFRVRAGGVEHAFDGVCGAGHVGSAFDVRECWSHQHQQESNDADDDEQLDQRKTPRKRPRCCRGREVGGQSAADASIVDFVICHSFAAYKENAHSCLRSFHV